MDLPGRWWHTCSIEERHKGDWSFQATVMLYPAVLVVTAAQKCSLAVLVHLHLSLVQTAGFFQLLPLPSW